DTDPQSGDRSAASPCADGRPYPQRPQADHGRLRRGRPVVDRNALGKKADVYVAFLEALDAYYGPVYCLGRLKEFTHYFARNYKFGHSLASKVQSSSSVDEASERAGTF
ncbi:MAG TPA: hypothetical protein VMU21_02045, partial [Thermodesulfovibrionales bacterium]|nr:hypothetical protein [Thermodesulfovibrionales bacterium]